MKIADYERLGLARMQLLEFRYAWERFTSEPAESDVSRRFYYHAIMQYFVSFYIADGGVAFFAFMREYGLNHMADEISELLDRKVGPHTIRQRITDFRDKLLSHPRYDGKVLRRLREKHQADSRASEYGTAIRELAERTYALAIGLENMLADLNTLPDDAEISSIKFEEAPPENSTSTCSPEEETRSDGGAGREPGSSD